MNAFLAVEIRHAASVSLRAEMQSLYDRELICTVSKTGQNVILKTLEQIVERSKCPMLEVFGEK